MLPEEMYVFSSLGESLKLFETKFWIGSFWILIELLALLSYSLSYSTYSHVDAKFSFWSLSYLNHQTYIELASSNTAMQTDFGLY